MDPKSMPFDVKRMVYGGFKSWSMPSSAHKIYYARHTPRARSHIAFEQGCRDYELSSSG